MPEKDSAEKAVRDIRRKTRRKFSAEEAIWPHTGTTRSVAKYIKSLGARRVRFPPSEQLLTRAYACGPRIISVRAALGSRGPEPSRRRSANLPKLG